MFPPALFELEEDEPPGAGPRWLRTIALIVGGAAVLAAAVYAAWWLLGQPRAHAPQGRSGSGVHDRSFLRPQHEVVRHYAAVEVECASRLEADHEAAPSLIDEEDSFSRFEGRAHVAFTTRRLPQGGQPTWERGRLRVDGTVMASGLCRRPSA